MHCKELDENLSLYLYDELPAEQGAACEAHLAACARCQTVFDEARRLNHLLSERPSREPTPELLVQCRQALDDALERQHHGWQGLLRSWWSVPPSRAVAALTLLVFGFSLGWTLHPRNTAVLPASKGVALSSFVGDDLGNLRIRSISQVAPDPQTGGVRITMDAERRVTLEGSLDDPHIRQVLIYAVKGYDNPGIRRDTLDALRERSTNPSVREALLYAVRKDSNPGVRLEALKAVRGMKYGGDVHQALIDALEHETNPGVRVAAINEVVRHAIEKDDEEALPMLKQWAAKDPNRYVRMKCLSAVRELTGDDF